MTGSRLGITHHAASAPAGTWFEVLTVFLRLGLTSFGGPIAHLGYFRADIVARRGWLDEHAYADLVALCQFLPGPASSQVGIGIGLSRAGYAGALAAWVGFTMPSAVALTLFGLGVERFGSLIDSGWLHGLKIAAVAGMVFVVVHAIYVRYYAKAPEPSGASPGLVARIPERVPRHSLASRLYHWLMAASMLTLLFTAFLPKVGVEFDWVTIHWSAGAVLTVAVVYHIIHASFWQDFWSIWPDRADLVDAWQRLDSCGADAELVRLTKCCLAVEPSYRLADGAAVERGDGIELLDAEGAGIERRDLVDDLVHARAHALQHERHDGIEIARDLRPILHDRRFQVLDDHRHQGLELVGRPHGRDQLPRGGHRVGRR